MRKISANYIFPVNSEPLKNGIVVINDNGEILDLIDTKGKLTESAGLEFYNGVIVPGFVNAHCHLELSYLKGIIPKQTGHIEFIRQIVEKIGTIRPNIKDIEIADEQMQREGIVAVGDISNTNNSAGIKKQSPIYYHSFIELADFFDENKSEKEMSFAEEIKQDFQKSSFVAHAPYTCSVDFIEKTARKSRVVYSIHNQEDKEENLMYKNAEGYIFDFIKERNNLNNFEKTGKSSLQSFLTRIIRDDLNILLIHNLFSSQEDIEFAENLSRNIYWTLCPNSNLYIQNRLPEVNKFIENKCKITLGTDSLATNERLSILEEMKNFMNIDFSEVLKWATINGAKALKIDNVFGSIEIGKKPGLNLISNFDFGRMNLKNDSLVRKII